MAEAAWRFEGPLDALARPGRHGADGAAGVALSVAPRLRQTILLARRDQAATLAEAARAGGLDLPGPGRAAIGPRLTLVATAPGQWLALSPAQAGPRDPLSDPSLSGLCTLVRADDGRVVIGIAGPRARDALAKVIGLDLHPRAFAAGHAAVTVAAGSIPVALWQIDETPRYGLAAPRSSVRSLWQGLLSAAAEYGVSVESAAAEALPEPLA